MYLPANQKENKRENVFTSVLKAIYVYVEKSKNTGRYKYEATIDENVPFIEVYEKYDVVKQKGNIWVLKDKEVNKNEQ